ncbi:maleylpyruvate isomerase N-terminal domain-containing protein [Amycolatopsis echigonensis]|uniref:Maleylpyruvate isomerase N-terminal domain-containing protein n=1 Tax=Amycolatopsis echigonensis TaxID=2576905 RepID=A0A8E1VTR6_9PSEU|nr:maleylpyruvate isomerase N-terminal domain-containing protein [Amycolatopsis echigonensis]MBB2498118.1 maleylpyruvate isomerase N-terminal domain-containing protein [Amycolatopsis echigonensis]
MDLFFRSWNALQHAVRSLEDGQWLVPSGCTGWLVQDLVFHLVIDAQDILITLATPSEAEPTHTAAEYWELSTDLPTGTEPESLFTRRAAVSYGTTAWLAHHFDDLAQAAGRAAALADPASKVETRDYVLTVADYFETYVVEATLHHLDLVRNLSEVDGPDADCLAATRRTVETALGSPLPSALDDKSALLVATGRRAATDEEKAALGSLTEKLPIVLG